MMIVNVLAPVAAVAGDGSWMPLWQIIVLGFLMLASVVAVAVVAAVVWVAVQMSKKEPLPAIAVDEPPAGTEQHPSDEHHQQARMADQ